MSVVSFSLSPGATQRVFDLLICLTKFGDLVSLEARSEKLTFTALNSSRTAYASFALDAETFFIDYNFNANSSSSGGDRFTCQLYNKALQSVFKGRTADVRGREISIDQCDVSILDQPEKTECRLVVKLHSKHGMTKTFRLTYESVEVMHALFDKTAATQGWRISSTVLREYVEYFGPRTEQLDLLAQEGKAIFTSFTEKIQDGKEVLKQPLETAIAIHTADFEDFHVQENMHIVISVKDFRAIVTHAETLKAPISAAFSYPTRPLQFSYQSFGVHCEFTLMTTGDYRTSSSMPNPAFVSTRTSSRQPSMVPARSISGQPSEMPHPSRISAMRSFSSQSQNHPPAPRKQIRPVITAEVDPDPDSLFMPNGGEDDQKWDPANFDREEDDEMLGWDASNDNLSSSMRPTIRDLNKAIPAPRDFRDMRNQELDSQGLEPTQRLSQLNGMFD